MQIPMQAFDGTVSINLVGPDGHTPAIDGFFEKVPPLNAEEKALIHEASQRESEALAMKQHGVEPWVHNVDWLEWSCWSGNRR